VVKILLAAVALVAALIGLHGMTTLSLGHNLTDASG
jgi:hypothetical protein